MNRARRPFASLQNHTDPGDVLEDRYLSSAARERLKAIREGGDELLDEEAFWAKADRIVFRTK